MRRGILVSCQLAGCISLTKLLNFRMARDVKFQQREIGVDGLIVIDNINDYIITVSPTAPTSPPRPVKDDLLLIDVVFAAQPHSR